MNWNERELFQRDGEILTQTVRTILKYIIQLLCTQRASIFLGDTRVNRIAFNRIIKGVDKTQSTHLYFSSSPHSHGERAEGANGLKELFSEKKRDAQRMMRGFDFHPIFCCI